VWCEEDRNEWERERNHEVSADVAEKKRLDFCVSEKWENKCKEKGLNVFMARGRVAFKQGSLVFEAPLLACLEELRLASSCVRRGTRNGHRERPCKSTLSLIFPPQQHELLFTYVVTWMLRRYVSYIGELFLRMLKCLILPLIVSR
jgi:hypothetical protein